MVINHLEKLFVTNDAATVIKELEVEHPAARMLVMATKMQEQEVCMCPCIHVCTARTVMNLFRVHVRIFLCGVCVYVFYDCTFLI